MPSFKTTALAVIALLVSAQAQVQYYIDPNSVPIDTRQKWCGSQVASCPLLCLQLPGSSSTTAANTCDATTLTYNCVCGNGQSPNATEYSQTLPFYICQEWGTQCVAGCGDNNACQSACTQDHPCGAQHPTLVNTTATSSTMTATATATGASGSAAGGPVYSGFGSGGSSVATTAAAAAAASTSASAKSGAQAALSIGQSYRATVIAATFFAGLTFMI